MNTFRPGVLLAQARRRAGLSQRELAARAGTAQSVVARIERGQTVPGAATLERLLHASGFELRVELRARRPAPTHMLADVARILSLSPEDRLREVANASRFIAAAKPSVPTKSQTGKRTDRKSLAMLRKRPRKGKPRSG